MENSEERLHTISFDIAFAEHSHIQKSFRHYNSIRASDGGTQESRVDRTKSADDQTKRSEVIVTTAHNWIIVRILSHTFSLQKVSHC